MLHEKDIMKQYGNAKGCLRRDKGEGEEGGGTVTPI